MIIKIIIIEEFLQESGFEKREKYFDWLTRGGRGGREGAPPCLVVLPWYFIGSKVVCFLGNPSWQWFCRWKVL